VNALAQLDEIPWPAKTLSKMMPRGKVRSVLGETPEEEKEKDSEGGAGELDGGFDFSKVLYARDVHFLLVF
jgi:hypothetical protein